MNKGIQILIESGVVFIFIFFLNYFLFVKKNKKLKEDEMPLELIYLSGIYGIDPKLINFKNFQYTYSIINSFIITTTYLIIIYLIKITILKVVIGVVILVLLIIICYGLLGRFYLYQQTKISDKKKVIKKHK